MNISDCQGFTKYGNFLDAINNFRSFTGEATYIIASSYPIHRLKGTSDILYIGQTGNLGGDNGRLWNYCYAQNGTNDWRITDYVQKILNRGYSVLFYYCQSPPNRKSVRDPVRDYESYLLGKYRDEHWELPPWNSQG